MQTPPSIVPEWYIDVMHKSNLMINILYCMLKTPLLSSNYYVI